MGIRIIDRTAGENRTNEGRMAKSRRTKATEIKPLARAETYSRDSQSYGIPCCIIPGCGTSHNLELAHYISRQKGGLGTPQNLVTLCRKHHRIFDEGKAEEQNIIHRQVKEYLQHCYPDWDESKLTYRRE